MVDQHDLRRALTSPVDEAAQQRLTEFLATLPAPAGERSARRAVWFPLAAAAVVLAVVIGAVVVGRATDSPSGGPPTGTVATTAASEIVGGVNLATVPAQSDVSCDRASVAATDADAPSAPADATDLVPGAAQAQTDSFTLTTTAGLSLGGGTTDTSIEIRNVEQHGRPTGVTVVGDSSALPALQTLTAGARIAGMSASSSACWVSTAQPLLAGSHTAILVEKADYQGLLVLVPDDATAGQRAVAETVARGLTPVGYEHWNPAAYAWMPPRVIPDYPTQTRGLDSTKAVLQALVGTADGRTQGYVTFFSPAFQASPGMIDSENGQVIPVSYIKPVTSGEVFTLAGRSWQWTTDRQSLVSAGADCTIMIGAYPFTPTAPPSGVVTTPSAAAIAPLSADTIYGIAAGLRMHDFHDVSTWTNGSAYLPSASVVSSVPSSR